MAEERDWVRVDGDLVRVQVLGAVGGFGVRVCDRGLGLSLGARV